MICRVCGERHAYIAPRHLRRHGLTIEDYRAMYPDAPLTSTALRSRQSRHLAKLNRAARNATRSSLRLGRWHPGESPVRHWPIISLLVKGTSPSQIAAQVRRRPEPIRHILSKLGLSQRSYRYDLGTAVKANWAQRLLRASGLDTPEFSRVFGIPSAVLRRASDRPSSRRVAPASASRAIAARDEIIRAAFETSRSRGNRRWHGPGASKVLASLGPNIRELRIAVRGILEQSRLFLSASQDAGAGEWENWMCQQARLEAAGGAAQQFSFAASLPLAVELGELIEAKLAELRGRADLWRVAAEILAARFAVTRSVIDKCGRPAPPHEIALMLLRLRAKPSARGGRKPLPAARKAPSKIFELVERAIPAGIERTRSVLVAARRKVWDAQDDLEYDTVSKYHEREMRRRRRANPHPG